MFWLRFNKRTILLIFLLYLFFSEASVPVAIPSSPPLSHSGNQITGWFQGYQKSLRGGTIKYHSPHPDVDSALLVRSLDSDDFIEWETELIPKSYEGNHATFIWMFGMDADEHPHSYDLYINDKKWFRFSNPRVSSVEEWTVEGAENAALRFRVTLIDRHDDVFGYVSLRIPVASLQMGKSQRLKVVGETAGSRVWYMTFQAPVNAGIKLIPQQALLKRGKTRVQPLAVQVIHLGPPQPIKVSVGGQKTIQAELKFGFNRVDLYFPEVQAEEEKTISIQISDKEPYWQIIRIRPVKKWTVYLVQHTHTDIGYTRPQSEILPEHLRFIDYALDYCDLTDDYPENAKFRWTCEASWAVERYLESRPPEQIARLKQRVEQGRIEITGMPFNMSEIADENIIASSLRPIKKFKDLGLKVTTAMQNDVNGIAWCLADFFPDTDIQYLVMGQHGHRALVPFEKPTAFWWESPSGKRLLAFRADHYMTANFWGLHTGKLPSVEQELLNYLRSLESRQYPYDRVAVQYSGYFTDNSPPSKAGCELIKRWNEKYAWPKLRSAIAREFLYSIKSSHGKNLSVHRVAWPDWWSDGFGSAALETSVARKTQACLTSIQGLFSMAKLLNRDIPSLAMRRLHKVYDALLFWDEHTLGAAESIRQPLVENTVVQWAEKSAYVWEAAKDVPLLQELAMGLLQSSLPRDDVPTIAVFNTLNWARTGTAEVYIDHEILPRGKSLRLVDREGKEIPAQASRNLADGTYWHLWVEDIPPMGYRVYRIESLPSDQVPRKNTTSQETTLENNFYRLKIDPNSGAIASLIDKQLGHELVDQNSKWQLGQFIHETISNRSQLEQFHLVSYQRTSLKNISMIKGSDGPLWQSLRWIGTTPTAEDKTAVQCDVRLFKNEKRIELHFSIIKKSITDPEAIYIAFPFCMPYAEVSYEAQGGMVSPGKNQLEKTSSDWHAVQSFTVIRGPKGQVVLGSTEVPLVQFGDLNLGKFQDVAHVEKPHLFSWVMNNYWVTNFRASQEGEFKWHYFLTSSENPSMTDAAQFGWGSRVPFFCRVFPSGKESAFPFERSLIRIDAENILLVSAKPSSDGEDIILHLRETEGKTAEFSLFCLSEGPCMVTKINVLGESIGNPAQKVRMKALESCFFKLERMR